MKRGREKWNNAWNDYLKESLILEETELPSLVSLNFPSSARLEMPRQDEVSFRKNQMLHMEPIYFFYFNSATLACRRND